MKDDTMKKLAESIIMICLLPDDDFSEFIKLGQQSERKYEQSTSESQ